MVMVVFDITDAESFKNCSAWLERCKPFVGKRVIPGAADPPSTTVSFH